MSRLIKGVLREFGYEAGIEICRGYMIERLREVTPKDLYKAIKNGTHSMGVSEAKDKQFGGKWVKIIEKLSFKGERLSRDKLTAENVLEWLKVDRPDLGSLLMNMGKEGMDWLKQDVVQVYEFLFPKTVAQPKPALTLVKREQAKEEVGAEVIPQKEETSTPTKHDLEQGAEDAGVHAETETEEKQP